MVGATLKTRILLTVPETLLKINGKATLVMTDSTGFVRVSQDLDVEDKFFALVRKKQTENKEHLDNRFPRFVLIQGERVRYTTGEEMAADMSRSCGSNAHLLQRFLLPQSNKVSKMRVHWVKQRNPISYTVTSKLNLIQKGELSAELRNEPYSIYARSTSVTPLPKVKSMLMYNRGSSTTNSSFSLSQSVINLRSNSVLKNQLDESKLCQLAKCPGVDNTTGWLVYSSNLKQVSIIKNKAMPKPVVKALDVVARVVQQHLLHKPFTVLLVDFMKDAEGNWVMLTCKGLLPHVCIELPLLSTEDTQDNYSSVEDFMPVAHKTKKSQTVAFPNLKSLSSFDEANVEPEKCANRRPLKSTPYINLQEIRQDSIKLYGQLMKRTKSGRIPKKLVKLIPPYGMTGSTQVINELATKSQQILPNLQTELDTTVHTIMNRLARRMDLTVKHARLGASTLQISGILSQMKSNKSLSIMRAFETSLNNCLENSKFKRLFENIPRYDFHIKSIRAFPCFVYGSKSPSGKKLKELHISYDINDEAYDFFETSFLNCLSMEGLPNDQVSVIRKRLEYFRKMIVSSSTEIHKCNSIDLNTFIQPPAPSPNIELEELHLSLNLSRRPWRKCPMSTPKAS